MEWTNHRHMEAMARAEFNGVADMMRWEILHAHGGIVVDADSIALRPLDDGLLGCEAFACWENEIARPGLIAAGYFGSVPGNGFLKHIIDDIAAMPTVVNDMAWQTVGPQRLTDSYRKYRYSGLRIYPSHYFIPTHFAGVNYDGSDPIYAHQLWGSTLQTYDALYQQNIDVLQRPSANVAASGVNVCPIACSDTQPSRSRLEDLNEGYFVQRVNVSAEIKDVNRLEVFAKLCEGKKVLHVGCADWPITDPSTSLHILLEPFCASLDGFDIHSEAMEQLAPYTKGRLYTNLEEIDGSYDLVLVPEVMEHVANVPEFLAQLQSLNSSCFLVSVPDAFQCHARHFDYLDEEETFVEVVHPDHNVWYTPYTLSNTIRKYSDLAVARMWFFNRISLLALLHKQGPTLVA